MKKTPWMYHEGAYRWPVNGNGNSRSTPYIRVREFDGFGWEWKLFPILTFGDTCLGWENTKLKAMRAGRKALPHTLMRIALGEKV